MPAMSAMESEDTVAPSIQIFVNGAAQTLAAGLSVDDLLGTLGLDPAQVAVERNGEIVPRRQRATTTLGNGDRLELVTFVGGG
jgi:thiamine biosynthesis protein ThiS